VHVDVYTTIYEVQQTAGKRMSGKQSEPAAYSQQTFSTDLNSTPPTAVVMERGKVIECVPLQAGADGFLCAEFANGTKHSFTTLPNLVLHSVISVQVHGVMKKKKAKPKAKSMKKKPAGADAKKRPASSTFIHPLASVIAKAKPAAAPAVLAVAAPVPAVAAPPVPAAPAIDVVPQNPPVPAVPAVGQKKYTIMYYKRTNCIGIRAQFGDQNQVFGFGGKRQPKGERELRAIAKSSIEWLANGMSYTDAKFAARQLCL
jgi:hypothetical protein